MEFKFNNVKIFYRRVGKGEPCLLLHGWAGSGEVFDGLVKLFPGREFIIVDFPPFGRSGKNIEEWSIYTYASMLMSLCEHLNIKRCDCIGHSFGGRVAILLCALKSSLIKSCVLVDSAGMKPRRGARYYFKLYKYKLAKKLGRKVKNVGSQDYQHLPPEQRNLFVSIVNEHLEEYCYQISAPTLIIFGKNDKVTPVYMAKRLHRLIKGSKCEVFEDAGHFAFLDCPLRFYKSVQSFWEGV